MNTTYLTVHTSMYIYNSNYSMFHVEHFASFCKVKSVLENRNEIVFFLIELPVDRAKHVFNLAASHISRDAPAERELVALPAGKIPLLERPMQAPHRKVRVFLTGVGHDDEEFVSALTKDNVAASKTRGEHPGEFSEQQVAFDVTKLGIDGAETVEVDGQEGQIAGQAVGTGNFSRNQFVHRPPVQQLGQGIDQRQTFQPLVQYQLADQCATGVVQGNFLPDQINIEKQDQRNQSEKELRQVGVFHADDALRPDDVGQNQRQHARGEYQYDQNYDRPQLQIASRELLNLPLDLFRARQHGRRRRSLFLFRQHSPSAAGGFARRAPMVVILYWNRRLERGRSRIVGYVRNRIDASCGLWAGSKVRRD